jgi:hypothetical protein
MTNKHNSKGSVGADNYTMPTYSLSVGLKNKNQISGSEDSKKNHLSKNGDDVRLILTENLPCPGCGKLTLHAKSSDSNSISTNCSSCGFVMKLEIDEWNRIDKSTNPKEYIKKMARLKELIGLA